MKSMSAVIGCILLFSVLPAHAYVGPGVGVTLIGWCAGCFLAAGAALFAAIAWPLRQLFGKRRKNGSDISSEDV